MEHNADMGIMREERAKTHNSTEERERKSGELRVRKPGAEIVVERKGKGMFEMLDGTWGYYITSNNQLLSCWPGTSNLNY